MMSSSDLRKKNFLLGTATPELEKNKLPTKKQVLQVLCYNTIGLKKTLKDSTAVVVNQLLSVWKISNIPTQRHDHCKEKLEKLYKRYRNVCKHKGSTANKQLEDDFKKELHLLFDVAHANVLSLIDEKKKFF